MDYSDMSREELIRANQELHSRLNRLQADNKIDYRISQDRSVHININENYASLFCCLSPDFVIKSLNDAFLNFFRIPQDQILGVNLLAMIKEEYKDIISGQIAALSPENPEASYEYAESYANREFRWLHWRVQALFDDNKNLIEYRAYCQDITESKDAWYQLQHRLNMEQLLIETSMLLVGAKEIDFNEILEMLGKALEVNEAYFFKFCENGYLIDQSWVWLEQADSAPIFEQAGMDLFIWGLKQIQSKQNITIIDRSTLPDNDWAKNNLLESSGIHASIMIPIFDSNQKLQACIGFNDTEKSRQWNHEDIKCFRLLSEILGSFWQRQSMEKALSSAEAQFRALADTAPAVIFVYSLSNSNMPLRYLNDTYPELTGYQVEDVFSMNWWEIIHPEHREEAKARALSRLYGEMNPSSYEMKVLSRRGKTFWVDISLKNIEWEGEPAVLGVIYDISALKAMEEELRQARNELEERVIERTNELVRVNEKLRQEIVERIQVEYELQRSEANFRKLAETSPIFICVIHNDQFLYINTTCAIKTGYSKDQIMAMDVWDFLRRDYHDIVRENNKARINGAQIPPYEVMILGNQELEICGYLYADLIEFEGVQASLVMIVDITERKRMEEDLLQASKLDSLGILAGGIAHDFNNILTVISGNVSLAKMTEDLDGELLELMNEIEQAAWQARDLTQQLLTFSKGGAPIKETASIQDLLRENASFVLRGSNVSCSFYIPDDLWPVSIDKGQISQVINNLIINANQAMPDGGSIILYADNCNSIPGHVEHLGRYVEVGIIDAGVGINPLDLTKVFDPYFSTKVEGHGLGLSSCYSIIKKHDGYIKISSDLDIGTWVRIYLPAFPEQSVDVKSSIELPLTGQGRILIMDDEAFIRETLSKMLGNLGYTSAAATDGQQVLFLYKQAMQAKQPYDAVILDLTIAGGMGGKEAIKKLLEIDPYAKVIVSSGYSNDPVMADFKSYGFSGVLPKPYQIQVVNQILHDVFMEELHIQVGT